MSRSQPCQRLRSMLGKAVSSSTPSDFHSSSHIGHRGSRPLMNRHVPAGLPCGCPYSAVGMQSAFAWAMGLPRRSMSAARMLAFSRPID